MVGLAVDAIASGILERLEQIVYLRHVLTLIGLCATFYGRRHRRQEQFLLSADNTGEGLRTMGWRSPRQIFTVSGNVSWVADL